MPVNGMAEAFVKTFKRDYPQVRPRPDAATVVEQLDGWFEHYKSVSQHPSAYAAGTNRFC
jgi:putative transposase